MQFNFVLTNHRAAELQALDDILRPLLFGLRAAGHRVVAGIRQLSGPPVVNIMVEDFSDPAAAREIGAARAAWGAGFRLGVLCPHDIGGLPPARADGLRAALPAFDFVWSLAPLDRIAPERIAIVQYGFHDSLLGPRLISDPAGRDLDVVVYGPNSPRLDALVGKLAAAQLRHFPVRAGTFPDYIVSDLLSRAKTVAVVGGVPGADAALAPRALKSICNGALTVAEEGSIAGALAGLLVPCPYDEIPAACRRIAAEGRFVERGLEALERLRQMPGMRSGVEAAAGVAAVSSAPSVSSGGA